MEYIEAKTILTKCRSTEWFGTDYNMNIYRGCCHGCIYCDSRSDCYGIDNFDKVRAKKDVLLLLRNELKRKVRSGVIGTGAMSDPYNPFEKELLLTRHSLELIDAFNFGAAVVTKSSLIARDADILQNISEHSPVICKITVTTADDSLCRKIEPNVSVSSERFEALRILSSHGIFPEENYREKYIRTYGNSYECVSRNADSLWKVFERECHKYGILYKMKDIISAYKSGYEMSQLSFF